jgi:hypothetical protein
VTLLGVAFLAFIVPALILSIHHINPCPAQPVRPCDPTTLISAWRGQVVAALVVLATICFLVASRLRSSADEW